MAPLSGFARSQGTEARALRPGRRGGVWVAGSKRSLDKLETTGDGASTGCCPSQIAICRTIPPIVTAAAHLEEPDMLADLSRLSNAESRSISPENPTGARGAGGQSTDGLAAASARELGQGWKVSPYIRIAGERNRHPGRNRGTGRDPAHLADGASDPLAAARAAHVLGWRGNPLGRNPDRRFLLPTAGACAAMSARCRCGQSGRRLQLLLGDAVSQAAPASRSKISRRTRSRRFYYQIDYTLTEIPDDAAYLHAQWRRSNPLPYRRGAHPARRRAGAGPLRRHLYRLGREQQRLVGRRRDQVLPRRRPRLADHLRHRHRGLFRRRLEFRASARASTASFSTPFLGMPQVIKPDGLYQSQQRFGMYRWHIPDPIRFQQDLRVTIQALGWRSRSKASAAICPCRTTSPRPPSGTSPSRTPRSRRLPSLNDLEVV